ncbi:amino acid adenylation domain-containing protein [Sorangium sp. So ce131]|uniref:amino acid adenylation domain-containing protein n=1 Tax=Sorangium sp. So ce131 TaxID=3133282 RepID=UPI003F63BFA1
MSRLQQLLGEIASGKGPSGSLFCFPGSDGAPERSSNAADLVAKALGVSGSLQRQAAPKTRIVIAMPHGVDFVASLLGCFGANVVAVPVTLASAEPTSQELAKIDALLACHSAAGEVFVLTRDNRLAGALLARSGCSVRLLAYDELTADASAPICLNQACEEDAALILLTSGSSGKPKGIILSHANVLYQARAGAVQWSMSETSRIVTWLSPSHNFGLHFGVMAPLCCGTQSTFIHPVEFMKRPAIWFETVKRVGATHIAAPNFALDLWTDAVSVLDVPGDALGTITHVVCGGEPVRKRSIERFFEKFRRSGARDRTFCAHYGLSETGALTTWCEGSGPQFLAVDGSELLAGQVHLAHGRTGVDLANCGRVADGITLRIVHPESGVTCNEGEVGEIWVKSPGVAKSYLDDEDADRQAFGWTVKDTGETGFFRTGDRGFVRDRCVYIAGREKDVIIVRGKNHFPSHIESTIAEVAAKCVLRPVVFGLEQGDRERIIALIGVSESLPASYYPALAAKIRRQVAEIHGVTVDELAFIETDKLLPPTVGKLNRRPIRDAFFKGKLATIWSDKMQLRPNDGYSSVTSSPDDKTEVILRRLFVKTLGERALQYQPDTNFSEAGLDSLQCVRLAGEIESAFGVPFEATHMFKYQTLREIAAHLSGSGLGSSRGVASAEPPSATAAHHVAGAAAAANVHQAEQIAVVGMHCEFPGAGEGTEALWNFLIAGGDGVGLIEHQRPELWEATRTYAGIDESALPRWAGLLKGVDLFDAPFFGISRREAECMDPQQRKVLEFIWKLAEASGHDPMSWSGERVGLYVAAHTADYGEVLAARPDLMVHSGAYIDSGTHHTMIPNRASRWFNFIGPSEVVNTACSSSIVAIHRAVESLRRRDCLSAIVVGVNLILTPRVLLASARAGMLAPDGRCKTLDAAADGFVRSEGVAGVLLKPLSRAMLDGDQILGVIRGVAVNHDGRSNSLRAPNVNAQKRLLISAYTEARVDPATVTYIELHGTGTNLGDPIEVQALKEGFEVLSPGASLGRCGLGSIKSNIGHTESAAGLASLIKVLLAFQYGIIPGTRHFKQLNPRIDLQNSPFRVMKENEQWCAEVDASGDALPLRAGISSFGFGGVNTHLILEQYRTAPTRVGGGDPISSNPALIVLSARNEDRLREQVRQLLEWMRRREAPPDLADLAYVLLVSRHAMEFRLGVAVRRAEELEEKLDAFLGGAHHVDGLCWGEVQRDRPSSQTDSEGSEHSVAACVRDGKHIDLLKSWVKGVAIDWRELYGNNTPRLVSLPTYPFARERYWVPDAPAAPRTEGNDRSPPLHPLIHRNASDSNAQRFSSVFSGSEFFLADHRIQGQRVLPAAVHLEMARAGVERATAARDAGWCVRLENVVFVRPIVVEPGGIHVHVALVSQEDGTIAFTVHSADGKMKVLHSQGRALWVRATNRCQIDLARLRMLSGAPVAQGHEYYESFAKRGLVLGATLQSVRHIHLVRDGEAGSPVVLGELRLPREVSGSLSEYVLHPSLLDGALQATLGLTHGEHNNGRMTMPFALQRLDVQAPLPERAWAVVRYSEGSGPNSAAPKIDINVCDDAGFVCASLIGLSSRLLEGRPLVHHVPDETTRRAEAEPPRELTLVPAWRAVDPGCGPVWPSVKQQVAVIGDSRRLHAMLSLYPDARVLPLNGQEGVEHIAERLALLGNIEHLFWAVPNEQAELFSDGLIDAQDRCVTTGFRLVKALLSLGYGHKPLGFTILTVQAQSVGSTDQVRPAHASVHGLAGALAKEYAHWSLRLIDLPEREPWPSWEQLLAQPAQAQGNALVYRNGKWFEPHLVPTRLPEPNTPVYRAGGVYVIVGGAGGLGVVFTEYLIRSHQARVVWIGRRARDAEIARKQEHLGKLGPAPHYIAADACDAAAMQAARREVIERFGRVHGVVLATIVLQDRSLARMEEDSFRASLRAKVNVSVQAGRAFQSDSLDFVLFFSSVQSMTKARGQSNYAAGCVFTDAFAQAWAQQGAPIKTINWGYWGNAGVVASPEYRERMARIGFGSIEPPEAMAALRRFLGSPPQQIVFMKATRAAAALTVGIAAEEPDGPRAVEQILPLHVPYDQGDASQDDPDGVGKAEEEQLNRLLGRLLFGQLRELGLFAQTTLDIAAWKREAGWPARYDRWLDHTLNLLREQGYLGAGTQAVQLRQVAAVPSMRVLWSEWDAYKARADEKYRWRARVRVLDSSLRALLDIIRGRRSATEVLFPEGSMDLVEGVYKGDPISDHFNDLMGDRLVEYIEQKRALSPQIKLSVVEIGAGTGGTSARMLERLRPYQASIAVYLYTDVSKAFLLHAQRHYLQKAAYLKTGLFNVERSPAEQGLALSGFDIVIAANVLHATRDARQAVRNAKALLRDHGLLLINEINGSSLFTHLTFGLLEGWWRYEDAALRVPGSPALSPSSWRDLLESEGFVVDDDPASLVQGLEQQIIVARRDAPPEAQRPMRQKDSNVMDSSVLRRRTAAQVKQLIARMLQVDDSEIDSSVAIDRYGVDSILIVELVNELKKVVGEVDAAIFFEAPSVDALVDCLIKNSSSELMAWVGIQISPETDAVQRVDVRGAQTVAENHFKELVGKILKIDPRQIDASKTLNHYGIDSIVVVELTAELQKIFGEIDFSLVFESQSIDALVRHFAASRPDALARWVSSAERAGAGEGDVYQPSIEHLRQKATSHLKELIGRIVKMDPRDIASHEEMSNYGIDSIVIVELTNELRRMFCDIDSALLFESQSIDSLVDSLIGAQPDAVKVWVGIEGERSKSSVGGAAVEHSSTIGAMAPNESMAQSLPSRASRSDHKETSERQQAVQLDDAGERDVAIIGMSGRYPGSKDVDEFWENLKRGVNCITQVPAERWDHSQYFDEAKGSRGKTYSMWGGFIEGVDRFDPSFFDIAPRDAAAMDPQERLFLQEAYRSIEDAGYTLATLSNSRRVGVFVGVMNGHYPGGSRHWSVANRVSYSFDFQGPSMAVDTACASSLTAVHQALESLHSGTSEVAIAGGVNLIVSPDHYIGLSSLGMLSSGDECRPFGDGADGFVDAEGCGAIVLKPLRRAIADGDHIYAIIKGSMVNAGGRSIGYAAPNPSALVDVVDRAIKQARIEPQTISYIEAHGTGTLLGDAVEVASLNRVFQAHTQDRGFCALGSVKSNIGHCESASGMASIAKVLLQMKHGQVVPSLHSRQLNQYIDFKRSPFTVQQELTVWKRPVLEIDGEVKEYPRRAGVSSFGAGGANAHLVLEEYVHRAPSPSSMAVSRSHVTAQRPALIVLSAKTEERLKARVKQLLDWMARRELNALDLADVAYTLQTGRDAMEVRLAAIVGSIEELTAKLQAYLGGERRIDALYMGDTAGSRDAIALLSADDDMADAITAWIAKGKYSKLLDLWVKGLPVDWNTLYGEIKPRRVSLPAYPFAGERCWISTASRSGPEQTSEQAQWTVSTTNKPQDSSGPRTDVERKLSDLWQSLLGSGPVGVGADFFELGGNSLLATQMISRVRVLFGVDVSVATLFESPMLESMASRIEQLSQSEGGARSLTIEGVDRTGAIPLSYAQERLWFVHEHMEDQRTSYNITSAMHFSGKPFSMDALRAAFNALVARHETLRTCFRVPDGAVEPRQVIVSPWVLDIPLLDVSEGEVERQLNEMSQQVFDLTEGPLLKVRVLRLAEDRHIVISNIHHIIADGWSFGVLIGELQGLYDSEVSGRRAELPPLAAQYADYAVWQRQQDLSAHQEYWKSTLEGYEDGLDLPYDYARTAGRAWRAATLQYTYPAELARRLADFSRAHHSTLFMSLLASLAVVLNRYTGREDLCIGTTIAGRDQIELEGLIGFFINILPLRLDLSGDPGFSGLLQRTRQVVLQGFEHQALPFEHLLSALRKQRDSSQIPLVPVIVRHQNFPFAQITQWSKGVVLERFELTGERTTPSEMDWQFFGDGNSLELTLEYAADLFSEETVMRMVQHHRRVLEVLLDRADDQLNDFCLLTEQEQRLYASLNNTACRMDAFRSLAERFESQVEATPDALACVSVTAAEQQGGGGARRLSYRQLNARANQVAHWLRAMGVGPETRVAVICDRSQELLIAMMAIFKAGGCYVPVDPQYPKHYIEQILEDAEPQVILSKRALQAGHADGQQVRAWLDFDEQERLVDERMSSLPQENLGPSAPPQADQLACLMYTSGSTGKPKGVMVPYCQIHNWLQASWQRSPLGPGEVMLQKTSIAFAVSVKELLSGLLAGVPQVMIPDAVVKDSAALAAAVHQWQVTRIHLVPSHLGALLESLGESAAALGSLQCIVTAGEALPQGVREEVEKKLPGVVLWNNYGCTELNDVTYFPASASGASQELANTAFVPIGKPIANTQVFVLDEQLRRVPAGVMGELHVDSVGMARGYWREPGLTAERFIVNPYSSTPGARLYKTGDMVRLLAHGSLEYLGRRDYEIKVRGHRVDVRHVEKVATAHRSIQQAVVTGWPPVSSGAQLAAYLVAEPNQVVDTQEIRRHLSEHLPTYMVPTLYTVVDALPKLPNGKLDRQGLPPPDVSGSREDYVAPRNELERRLADIFGDVLGVQLVGAYDDFFNLGGHSLLASQVATRVEKELDVHIPMAALFQRPTVELLSEFVRAQDRDAAWAIGPAENHHSPAVLSFAQERMWFLHKFVKGVPYNTPGLALLTGDIDVEALKSAIRTVIKRHTPLRTNFVEVDGAPFQIVSSEAGFELPMTPIRDKAELDNLLRIELMTPFDLERDLPIRANLYRIDQNRHYMAVTIHHIAFDGWSLPIFFHEVAACYSAYLRGGDCPLGDLKIEYADYARWEREFFKDETLEEHLRYWRAQLAGVEPLVLPTTYPRPPFQSFAGGIVTFEIDSDVTGRLKVLCAESGATVYMVLLSALGLLLARYSGQDDICLGSPVANRNRAEVQDLIGLFVNTLVMRVNVGGNPRFIELLGRVQQTAHDAYAHQDVPFEKIVDDLQMARDTARSPLVQVMLNFQNTPAGDLDLPGLIVTPMPIHNGTAKFEITVDITQTSRGLSGFVEYASDVYSQAFIERLIGHYKVLLDAVLREPRAFVDELPLLTRQERRELLPRYEEHRVVLEQVEYIHRIFERRVQEHPHERAVRCGDEQITFSDLDLRANRIAKHLRSYGVKPDTLVALCVERSIDMVVGVLGILKAGGAYVPIDANSSPGDIYRLLYESQVGIVVTKSHLLSSIPVDDQKILVIDAAEDAHGIAAPLDRRPGDEVVDVALTPECLAYVNFVSHDGAVASGVMVDHGAIVSRLVHCHRNYFAGSSHRFLLKAPFALDLCTAELLQWIVSGGTLSILNAGADHQPSALIGQVSADFVSVIYVVPSLLSGLLQHIDRNRQDIDRLKTLRFIICGGDLLFDSVVQRFSDLMRSGGVDVRIVNAYGTKETGMGASYLDCTPVGNACVPGSSPARLSWGRVPIGEPAANTQLHVLLANGEPSPEGVPGQLYVGGAQLARGYHNDPVATNRDFVIPPFRQQADGGSQRLYRTGDLARRLQGGGIEVIGRVDDEDRIRDRRVDLGFIESQIRRLSVVHDAVVVYREDLQEKARLVAYVVLQGKTSIDDRGRADRSGRGAGGVRDGRESLIASMNAELRASLTDYMLPTVYVFMDSLPLTVHGRIDKKALPRPEYDVDANSRDCVAPRNEVEEGLARVWQQVLRLTQVGVKDNFFDLGGHSILAIQLISSIRKYLEVEVPVTLIFESPMLESMASRIEQLSQSEGGARSLTIEGVDRTGAIPLSYAQERLWFVHEHMEDQRTSYNITSAMHFSGKPFSMDALRAAFNALVARHETLRTCFRVPDGAVEPRQVIVSPWVLDIPLLDVSEGEVERQLNEMSQQVFDLTEGPLLKVRVLRLAEDRHIVISNIHHIIADGWSFGVLIGELQGLYDSEVSGRRAELPPLAAQYADYAVWQRQQDLSAHQEYWKSTLEGYEDGLDLPYDYARTAGRAWRAATLQYTYPAELARRLADFSRAHHSTLFMSLLASLAVVLNRYTGREDLCIGTTIAGRDQIELEGLIGFFINILPLRLDLSGDPGFSGLLQRTRQVVLQGFEHQALPFEHLLSALRKQRDSSQIPLVPVIVRHQNFPFAQITQWSKGVVLERFELTGERTTPSEMDWQFFGDGNSLELTLEYAADLFSEETVMRMVQHHRRVLEVLLDRADDQLNDFCLLTEQEQRLYASLNNTACRMDAFRSLAERFESQVEATPDALACVSVTAAEQQGGGGARRLSYRQLNARANQVAHWLRAMGVGPETRVAVICDRSQELLIAMMAIFKAGGCYVPVDPQYPKHYIEQILEDAEPQVILSKRALQAGHADGQQVRAWLDFDEQERLVDERMSSLPQENLGPSAPPQADQLACLMYTSGSTGKPKGVMVPYCQIHNWLQASWQRSPLGPGEVMLQKTSIAFAVSVKELLSGLLAGVPQVMIPDAVVKDSAALAAAVHQWQVTRIHLVPSHLGALLESLGESAAALGSLQCIVTAGEALPQGVREEVEKKLPGVVLWNNYGCTELNDVTYFPASASGASQELANTAFVPIGKPIANTQVFVLDEQLRRVPVGVMGELHVDSVGMARGYWREPGLTAERFIVNPYSSTPGARLYKTGDMVRLLAHGSLEYLGRRDYEIKVRGHRVDVRHVEKVATAHRSIQQAVVTGWPPVSSGAQLAAYLVAEPNQVVDTQEIRRHLSEHLPTYMVPTLYTVVDALPKLPNGKLDRQGLPPPDVSGSREDYVAPRNELERRLADIFGDVLGVQLVGAYDDFFNLGGHSLLASQLISRIRQVFRVELAMTTVFEHPEVEQLAQRVELKLREESSSLLLDGIQPVDRSQDIPLSYLQERLWFVHHHMEEQRTSYNGTIALRLRGPLSIVALRAAFNALAARHEALRTTFRSRNGNSEPVQVIHEPTDLEIPVQEASEADVLAQVDDLASHVYDLVNGPLFMVRILRLSEDHHVLLIGMHHIIYDAWSQFNVMSRDVGLLYTAYVTGVKVDLPALPIQYADYSLWQRKQNFDRHVAYWKAALSGYRDGLDLPYDYPRPPSRTWHAASITFSYPEPLAREFAKFTRAHQSTLFMGLLTSFAIVLRHFTGRDDICIGTTTAGRSHVELENLIGFFINVLPLRVDLSGDPDVAEIMRRAKRTVLGAFEHQALPFERLLSALHIPRDSSQIPLVPVVLRHQNFPTAMSDNWHGGLTMEVIERDERTTPNELDLQFFGDDSYLRVTVEYAAELFSEATVRRIIQHHRRAMEFMVRSLANGAPKSSTPSSDRTQKRDDEPAASGLAQRDDHRP